MRVHKDVQVDVQCACRLRRFCDLDRHTLRRIFYAPAIAVKPVVVARPEVEPHGVFGSQKVCQGDVGQRQVFRDRRHFGVPLAASGEKLSRLVPLLIGAHAL